MTDFYDFEKTVGNHIKANAPAGLKIRWPNQKWAQPKADPYWWVVFNYVERSRGSLGAQIDARAPGNVVIQVESPIGSGTKVHTTLTQQAVDLMDELELGDRGQYRFAAAGPLNLGENDRSFVTQVTTEFVIYD